MARSENQQAMMRIATVLLSLADVAERASARPLPVLWLVLCFLRPAEAIARQFVADSAWPETRLELDQLAPTSDDPAPLAAKARTDALRLAGAFRMLAILLESLAAGTATDDVLPSVRRATRAVLAWKDLARLAPAGADTS